MEPPPPQDQPAAYWRWLAGVCEELKTWIPPHSPPEPEYHADYPDDMWKEEASRASLAEEASGRAEEGLRQLLQKQQWPKALRRDGAAQFFAAERLSFAARFARALATNAGREAGVGMIPVPKGTNVAAIEWLAGPVYDFVRWDSTRWVDQRRDWQ